MFRKKLDEPTAYRVGFLNGIFAFVSLIGLAVYVAQIIVAYNSVEVEPAKTVGTPLRAADAVFLLTTQYETRVIGGGSRWTAYRGFEKVMHVDIWRLDARSAQPVWRKRLLTERHGDSLDLGLLGAEDDRLWVFMREPLVVTMANGEVVADAAAIEKRNPALAGVLPRRMSHYRFFDRYGLALTAADARAWLLDARSLEAVPWKSSGAAKREGAIGPPYYAASSSTSFQRRGLTLERNWVGVLTDDEAAALEPKPLGERPGVAALHAEYMRAPPDLAHTGPKRYRLWQSKVEQISAAPHGWPKTLPDNWGKRPYYSKFAVFEKSPEFLQAGLLGDGRSKIPLLTSAPDSVLVLHRDRIDDDGRLHVTRMAGPDGRVLWDAALPLSILQSVMPSADTVILFGRGFLADRPRVGDPYHSAQEWVIALDLKDGAPRLFNLSAADTRAE